MQIYLRFSFYASRLVLEIFSTLLVSYLQICDSIKYAMNLTLDVFGILQVVMIRLWYCCDIQVSEWIWNYLHLSHSNMQHVCAVCVDIYLHDDHVSRRKNYILSRYPCICSIYMTTIHMYSNMHIIFESTQHTYM